jgi:hypothetical protein
MNGTGLAYDDTPPFAAPLRFFLTAPLFGLAAGVVLVVEGDALGSRWTPAALALVHLLTTGVMLQVMTGALLQILPVVAGAPLPAVRGVANLTHLGLGGGAAALSWGLGRSDPLAMLTGATLLGAGLLVFLVAALLGLRHAPVAQGHSRTPRDLRLALAGLLVTAILGVLLTLVLALGVELPLPLLALADLHAGWGWMGWGGALLAATSWVVVPMFQITPAYPAVLSTFWVPGVGAALLLWSLALGLNIAPGVLTGMALLGVLALLFACTTLRLQARSRRSIPDASFLAFRDAMLSMMAGVAAVAATPFSAAPLWPVLAGVLILHGGFVGVISAMLYKIVPFLAWLHLTQAGLKAPNMKKLLPDRPVRRQLRLHRVALVALLLASGLETLPDVSGLLPPVTGLLPRVAGLLLIGEFGWLWVNLLRVALAWHRAGGRFGATRPCTDARP